MTAPGDPATGVTLDITMDRDAVTIGDPVTLTVRLTYPAGTRILSFEPERSLGSVGLLDRAGQPPRRLPDGRMEEVQTLRVAAYEVGRSEIPAIEVAYADASGQEGSTASVPVSFTVASVLTAEESEPSDIKDPAVMPVSPLWPWIALAIVAAGLAFWLFWRRRRRHPAAAVPVPAGPARPVHEIAYAELERLLSSGLLERGALKEFYIELAEIVRRYLGARFGIETFERTTGEILASLRTARLSVKTCAATAEFFIACDLVKFARHHPREEETRGTVERAYRLVDETRPVEAPAMAQPVPAVAQGGGG